MAEPYIEDRQAENAVKWADDGDALNRAVGKELFRDFIHRQDECDLLLKKLAMWKGFGTDPFVALTAFEKDLLTRFTMYGMIRLKTIITRNFVHDAERGADGSSGSAERVLSEWLK